jgi:hypothetical protein
MGLAWGYHGVSMMGYGVGASMGPGAAWSYHGVGMAGVSTGWNGVAWGWHGPHGTAWG